MKKALELAKRAGDGARPNPRVGAVLVKGGKLVGTGFHRRAGEPHAEAIAIQQAGSRAKGADLYVTMEPCSTHGRTPPCTGAIRRAGIKRVIFGSGDVDPRNAARSEQYLQTAGIRVIHGILKKECDELNEDYFHWARTHRPWVVLKLAMTLDGALALPGRRWITGTVARAEVQRIRAGCDAILVGAETLRKDNPRLTLRGLQGKQPCRVVVTQSGNLPKRAKVFDDEYRHLTLVYRRKSWDQILQDLYRRGIRRLLVEGGAKIAESLLVAGRVQEMILHIAPDIAKTQSCRPGPRFDLSRWLTETAARWRYRPLGRDGEWRGQILTPRDRGF